MKCEKCKQDLNDHRRVSELKKEVFRLRTVAKQLANAQNLESRDEVVYQNLALLQLEAEES